jgi:hypothetical protein
VEPAINNPGTASTNPHRLLRGLRAALVLLILVVVIALLRNNFSFHKKSRAAFDAQVNLELDRSFNWIKDNAIVSERNVAMMYMIAEMESMSHDPRLQAVLDGFKRNYLSHPGSRFDLVWFRLVDPNAAVPVVQVPEMGSNVVDSVWYAYALAPNRILLTDGDRANLFSPTKYIWGARQKQLLGLAMYREYNGRSPDLDDTIDYVAEKVARDAQFDIRLTDSYMQRVAFLLAAERPDLVRRRWVDRILDHQKPNGSWEACWYGWCRGVFEFSTDYKTDLGGLGHATVQAAWVLTMLKYHYPQWIEENYHN